MQFYSHHHCHFSSTEYRCCARFDQTEIYTGILVPVLKYFTSMAKDLEEAFSRLDSELKTMAEVGHVERS